MYKHGQRYTKLYHVWLGLNQRCTNPNREGYHLYGGRGIKVCDCLPNFETFYEWAINNEYAEGMTIERKDVNGNYCICQDNLMWATQTQQARNRRPRSGNNTGISGVLQLKNKDGSLKWDVNIMANGKRTYLGRYYTLEEAVSVRRAAELKYW